MRETQITVNGVRSPVLHTGPSDSSEAVVFVHGIPGPGDDYKDLVRRAGQFSRAVAPDMPGFGRADKPSDFDYTVTGYSEHLARLLDELDIRRAHLVVHDFGGAWALSWATSHPDAFASAVLINTGALVDFQWHSTARMWRTPVLGELSFITSTRPVFRWVVGRENPRLPRDYLDHLHDQFKERGIRRAILRLYRATPAAAFEAFVDPLRALDRPALVLWGTDDLYIPAEQAERQRQAFPSAQIELLQGHGHWPFLENPDRVASLVVPFLRDQVSDPRA